LSKILRVFPRRTSHTPRDERAFVGDPPLWLPDADEVHVSVTFSWDVAEGKRLAEAWANHYGVVRLGGPAFGSPCEDFAPGLYVRQGVTFTSRGCNNQCPWCLVPHREGRLRLLPITDGHVVQDNNLLQTPREHQEAVYEMLRRQAKAAKFSGGLQASLVDDWVARQFRSLRIAEVWLACDSKGAIGPLREAAKRLSFLRRDQMRCYVLVGFGGETVQEAAQRLEAVWDAGCMPFAQWYRDASQRKATLSEDWHRLVRAWSRPAAMRVMHKGAVASDCAGSLTGR
jgi:hypothetical protein